MNKLALLLALAALAFAGWQYTEGAALQADLESAQVRTAELRADVDRLAKALGTPREVPVAMPPALVIRDDADADGEPRDATLVAKGASPEVLARTVQGLQVEMAELRKENEELQEKVAKNPMLNFKRPKWIANLNQAEKLLELSPTQKADISRIVDYTKRELEDLYNTPSADGKTWKEVSQVKVQGGSSENGGIQFLMSNFQEVQKFRSLPMPGTNETFGEREKRIKAEAKQDVRDTLNEEQKKTFDEARSDALFGSPSGGVSSVSFGTTVIETTTSDD